MKKAQILPDGGEVMGDVSNEKLMPASSDATPVRRRGFDWPHVLVELATVVTGILIALAINNWAETRHNAALEARYLERLLADSTENLTMLHERVDLLTRRTDQLTRLSRWLTEATERPTDEEIFGSSLPLVYPTGLASAPGDLRGTGKHR